MLPHVATEDRFAAMHQRVLAVRCFGADDFAVLDRQPSPTRPELCDAGLNEVFLHLGDRADIGNDLFFEVTRKLVAAAVGFHPLPKMQMVVMLACVVEQSGILSERALDD